MDNIFNLIQQQLTPDVIATLSKQIRSDEATTATAAQGAISAIVGALSKESANPAKASSLLGALDRDHDGSILNDVVGLLSGSSSAANSRSNNGLGILEHLLGGNTNNIVAMLSQGTGLDFLKSGKLLQLLAPIVMGSLGKAKTQNVVNQNNVFDFLSGSVKQAAGERKELSMIEKILDSDGDGSVMDDVAGMGMKFLGGLLRR
ncbi:DUF937 domain-containing protein [Portibacter lacus]|uniref:DUF937 domain-containing protein n=1 Tax=Portibacter lacus TaxID=1099794 RepID=A0AA37SMW9_9BACT|nr:DUF937 domain-containing protein [Portibacter lacus]GLR15846.1 hypothetical protein GCM10007940_04610 [Portibacter lacus]